MRLRCSHGFTIVELVTILIILGILAVVAIPRMDFATSFRSVEFRDRVIAALRYAQKTATSHRRLVCATLTATTVALDIDSSTPKDGSCDGGGLTIPGGATSTVTTGQGGFQGSLNPDKLYFQPDGRVTVAAGSGTAIADFDATVEDGGKVVVWGATGYVGDGT